MPYDVSWVVENRISLVRFISEITLDEMRQANQDSIAYIQQGSPGLLFHSILDTTQLEKFPMKLNLLTDDSVGSYRKEPNLGWILLISHNRMISFLSSMTVQLTQTRFRVLQTVDEAIAFLKDRDVSLSEVLNKH
jgi:hypothetical protein